MASALPNRKSSADYLSIRPFVRYYIMTRMLYRLFIYLIAFFSFDTSQLRLFLLCPEYITNVHAEISSH